MDEYAKMVAIAFAEWKEKKDYWADEYEDDGVTKRDSMRWSNNSANPQYLTTEELYNLFLEDQNKQP